MATGISTAECAQKKYCVAMELVHFISLPSKIETSHSTWTHATQHVFTCTTSARLDSHSRKPLCMHAMTCAVLYALLFTLVHEQISEGTCPAALRPPQISIRLSVSILPVCISRGQGACPSAMGVTQVPVFVLNNHRSPNVPCMPAPPNTSCMQHSRHQASKQAFCPLIANL